MESKVSRGQKRDDMGKGKGKRLQLIYFQRRQVFHLFELSSCHSKDEATASRRCTRNGAVHICLKFK